MRFFIHLYTAIPSSYSMFFFIEIHVQSILFFFFTEFFSICSSTSIQSIIYRFFFNCFDVRTTVRQTLQKKIREIVFLPFHVSEFRRNSLGSIQNLYYNFNLCSFLPFLLLLHFNFFFCSIFIYIEESFFLLEAGDLLTWLFFFIIVIVFD